MKRSLQSVCDTFSSVTFPKSSNILKIRPVRDNQWCKKSNTINFFREKWICNRPKNFRFCHSFMPSLEYQGLFPIESDVSILNLIACKLNIVDFHDPPLYFILFFHILSLIILIRTRNNIFISSAYFGFITFCILATPKINTFMMANFSSFYFSIPYFDETYIFIFIFWTIPLTFNCILLLFLIFFDICKQSIEKLL